jgi:tetratricopeptide (TPR) repeat protein
MARPSRAPRCALSLALTLGSTLVMADALAGVSSDPPRTGAPGMLEPHTGSLLVDYFETFLRDHDIDAFRLHVRARYTEGTLGRMISSPSVSSRRAAVLALGLIGTFESNAVVARALRDSDPTVREMADHALWAIWFRADTPENNETLETVRMLIGRNQLEQAVDLATRLIGRAPNFAEAYNQRAIAHFFQGHFAESAADCRRVLERNPYHSGALSGLGRCQIQLNQRSEALHTFRQALKVQPFNEGFRQLVTALESEGD